MTEEIAWLIDEYIALKIGEIDNQKLISHFQDKFGEDNPPKWVEKIATLSPEEMDNAHHVLEQILKELKILPDSNALRLRIREALKEWVNIEIKSNSEDDWSLSFIPTRLFWLIPDYDQSSIYIPIEDYPYIGSGVETKNQLFNYIKRHLEELVPLKNN